MFLISYGGNTLQINYTFEQYVHNYEQFVYSLEQYVHNVEQYVHNFEQFVHNFEQYDHNFKQYISNFEMLFLFNITKKICKGTVCSISNDPSCKDGNVRIHIGNHKTFI